MVKMTMKFNFFTVVYLWVQKSTAGIAVSCTQISPDRSLVTRTRREEALRVQFP